ncbi:MAG: hypothetical protein JJU32_17775 [Phormidium sp. BM_Day4_Bin.17]|nr:hypothetical protein [Phormidium sp. BM_Day4_Bin.17]UCJ12673.1 MAG: hypothetical protein JWS08_02320 [Phormidium sp. PBR-2020]
MTTILDNIDNPLIGTDDNNLLQGTAVGVILGLEGDDTIISALNPTEPGSTLIGNAGNDYIRSRGIGDWVFGGPGNDTLVNENGRAILYGNEGNDYLLARDSRTTLFGGGTSEDSPDDGNNFLVSAGGKNILVGGGGNDTLVGLIGGDTMAGRGGNDVLIGGPQGKNFLFGNRGLDSLLSISIDLPDSLYGGQGEDSIVVGSQSTANTPLLVGGLGADTLRMESDSVDGAILLGDVGLSGQFEGTDAGDDYLYVAAGNNHQLFGNAGQDTLSLGINVGVGVSLFGGRGNDLLIGTGAANTPLPSQIKAFGDKGDDTLMLAGSDSEFWGDNPFMTSGFGNNTVIGIGIGNTLRGGNDFASGTNAGNNLLIAKLGNLQLAEGQESKNILMGGAGDDTLDASESGPGDTLIGGIDGAGNNTYIFRAGQYIQPDLSGINTYIGIGADTSIAVTVRAQDVIKGEGNFFMVGNQNNVLFLEKGGIITDNGDKVNIIDISGDASGITKTGDGNDQLTFGNVSGNVDAGGGNDTITVANSVSGIINAGAGNDLITVNGSISVESGGVINGGDGDDTILLQGAVFGNVKGGTGKNKITAHSLKDGGIIDCSEGEDNISITNVFGGGKVIVGGISNSVNVNLAYSGARFTALSGNNSILLDSVSATVDQEGNFVSSDQAITISGGAGNDFIGLRRGGAVVSGSVGVSFNLSASAGNNIMQSGGFSDIIAVGNGDDVIYGGKASFSNNKYNGFDLNAADAAKIAKNFRFVSDGDLINLSRGGHNKVVFQSKVETGFELQAAFNRTRTDFITLGTDGTQDLNLSQDLSDRNLLIGTSGQFLTSTSGTTVTQGVFSGAIGVDTLTSFNITRDQIVLDQSAFTLNTNGIQLFQSRGALYGVIADGSGAGFDYSDFGNVINGSGYFHESFVIGATSAADVDIINFNTPGQLYFDTRGRGLYLGFDQGAKLIAHLPQVNLRGNIGITVENTFVVSQRITQLNDEGLVNLF